MHIPLDKTVRIYLNIKNDKDLGNNLLINMEILNSLKNYNAATYAFPVFITNIIEL